MSAPSTSGLSVIDLFTDTAAILISIVSNSCYGMPRGQIHINLPPEHPIMSFETIEIKMAAVSAKRSIKSYCYELSTLNKVYFTLLYFTLLYFTLLYFTLLLCGPGN